MGARDSATGERRDYARLAGLVGFGRREYERLDPRSQRLARLDVDRELALRKELRATAGGLAANVEGWPLTRRGRIGAHRASENAVERRMRPGRVSLPSARAEGWRESRRTDWRAERIAADERESSVMRDARAVAERRKRQLGRDRG